MQKNSRHLKHLKATRAKGGQIAVAEAHCVPAGGQRSLHTLRTWDGLDNKGGKDRREENRANRD